MPIKNINAEELRKLIENDQAEIIDVREPEEYKIIHIKSAKNIPMNELTDRLDEIDWSKQVIFHCRTGYRSKLIARVAESLGKEVANLKYGILECYKTGGNDNLEVDEKLVGEYFD